MDLTSRLAVTAGAARLTANLQGRGMQPTDEPSHGVLYMRWVHDDRGNAWGDHDGETVFYTVTEADVACATVVMRESLMVSLIVRQHGVDYNFGTYLIVCVDRWAGAYRVTLGRAHQPPSAKKNPTGKASDVYTVKRITRHRRNPGWMFRVQWKGYRQKTWEPLKNLVHGGRINIFLRRYCKHRGLSQPLRLAARRCK